MTRPIFSEVSLKGLKVWTRTSLRLLSVDSETLRGRQKAGSEAEDIHVPGPGA